MLNHENKNKLFISIVSVGKCFWIHYLSYGEVIHCKGVHTVKIWIGSYFRLFSSFEEWLSLVVYYD